MSALDLAELDPDANAAIGLEGLARELTTDDPRDEDEGFTDPVTAVSEELDRPRYPGWDDPDPLPSQSGKPFPVHVLGPLAPFATAVAAETGTPPDLAGTGTMGVVSAVVSGALTVQADQGWREPCNLYLAGIMASGEGKTPALRRCKAPLELVEARWQLLMAPRIVEQALLKDAAKARVQEATKIAAKVDADTDAQSLLLRAGEDFEGIRVQPAPRLYTTEATPEGLTKLLGSQGGQIAVITDEGGEFFELAGRYAVSGKSNLGVYLQGHDGERYVSDRAGRDPVVIDRTTLTVYLLAQPVVLEALAKDRQAAGRGLLARFLWLRPASIVGRRPVERPPVPEALRRDYEELVADLADQAVRHQAEQAGSLQLNDVAAKEFLAWRERHEPKLDPSTGELASIVDWASKLPGQVLRLAGILHTIRTGALVGRIDAETMAGALELANYFTDHALCVFGEMKADQAVADALDVLRWIKARGLAEFTTRELSRSKGWKAERVRAACEELEGWGWLKSSTAPEERGAGRPPELWTVYPGLPDRTRQNPRADRVSSVLSGVSKESD